MISSQIRHSTKERKEEKNKSWGKLTPNEHGQTLPPNPNAVMQTLKIPPVIAQCFCEEVGDRGGRIPRLLNKYDQIYFTLFFLIASTFQSSFRFAVKLSEKKKNNWIRSTEIFHMDPHEHMFPTIITRVVHLLQSVNQHIIITQSLQFTLILKETKILPP